MPRYILSEFSKPSDEDYYYEANYYTSNKCYVNSHDHEYYEFYLFMNDGGRIVIDGVEYALNRGCVAIIPPKVYHTMLSTEGMNVYEKYYLWITEHALGTFIFNEYALLPIIHDAVAAKNYIIQIDLEEDIALIRDSFKAIALSKKEDNERYGKELMNRSRILASLVTLNRNITKVLMPTFTQKKQKQVSDVIQYINDHFTENISLETIEKTFHINKFYLSKLFKEYTDTTIHNYLTKQRIEYAKNLMMEGMQPTKVYQLCGYHNYTSFFRAFERTEGFKPCSFK